MLIGKRAPRPARLTPEIRPRTNATIYAIGDVHGRLDLFNLLLDRIRRDVEKSALEAPPTLVLLGDLIDRGPESAGCIERAITLESEGWCDVHALKGNHEEAVLLFVEDHEVGPNWVQHGGDATLQSYGVNISEAGTGKGWAGVREAFLPVFPLRHLEFIQKMKLWLEVDDYLFVHAGVRPGLPIERQAATDLLWIRQDFLAVEIPYPGRVVVHGHTPTREVNMKRWRIGIDTGAYASGILTAVRLRGYERALIQAS
jgi:serine/threonine protein phosphatase 1